MGRLEVAKHLNDCLNAICQGSLFYQRDVRGPQGTTPWGARLEPKASALLEEFLRQDEKHVTDLLDAIDRLGEHPDIGPYGFERCHDNFLDPKFLVRVLSDELEQDANAFEKAARPIEKDPTVGGLVRGIAGDKRKQIARLRELIGPQAPAGTKA